MELLIENKPTAGSSEKRITITECEERPDRINIDIRYTRTGASHAFAVHRDDLPRLAGFIFQAILKYYIKRTRT